MAHRNAAPLATEEDLVMLRNVMQATGLSQEVVEGFLMTDRDLDDLCDCVLSDLAVPGKAPPDGVRKTGRP